MVGAKIRINPFALEYCKGKAYLWGTKMSNLSIRRNGFLYFVRISLYDFWLKNEKEQTDGDAGIKQTCKKRVQKRKIPFL